MAGRIVFRVTSPLGYTVTLTRNRWREIVRFKHPAIKNYQQEAKQCILQPDLIRASATDPEVHLYCLSLETGKHVCVAVARGDSDEHFIVQIQKDERDRGNRFEELMNKIFDYYSEESKGSFSRTGEQLDGQFYFDKHWYYVEVRWKKKKAKAADISVLRDLAKNAFGGDTKALFISFNGFTDECLESRKGKSDERVILMDGYDLRCVLDGQISFRCTLGRKERGNGSRASFGFSG